MRHPTLLAVAFVFAAAACGNSIGDPCTTNGDCSQNADRVCDGDSLDGYCTIRGCDFDTCPEEAVCVSFFPVANITKTCATQDDCTLDEVCTLGGKCAPRATEQRFCMLKCGGHGDCRDGYECRDQERMEVHGGEPVRDPSQPDMSLPLQSFCGSTDPCTNDAECDFAGDRCLLSDGVCDPP